ncbi:hypothetical protein [Halogeometricum luteum]|uniref:Uncharacterized protein n=1 Tax=Halogeometricum luteum TaxID=2950537 RepID=A0ABU2G6W6_9EURY|nr:hypothetical protein [Halogeometricum sp. S3BR5-2]MDS0295974.1 hypothetical protein [Halogeometricum sp. S3BR5-2]
MDQSGSKIEILRPVRRSMDRQQILALILVVLMCGSTFAYGASLLL